MLRCDFVKNDSGSYAAFTEQGIEIKIISMQEDVTQSWMVICWCVDNYVTELAVNHTNPFHYDEASLSTRNLLR